MTKNKQHGWDDVIVSLNGKALKRQVVKLSPFSAKVYNASQLNPRAQVVLLKDYERLLNSLK